MPDEMTRPAHARLTLGYQQDDERPVIARYEEGSLSSIRKEDFEFDVVSEYPERVDRVVTIWFHDKAKIMAPKIKEARKHTKKPIVSELIQLLDSSSEKWIPSEDLSDQFVKLLDLQEYGPRMVLISTDAKNLRGPKPKTTESGTRITYGLNKRGAILLTRSDNMSEWTGGDESAWYRQAKISKIPGYVGPERLEYLVSVFCEDEDAELDVRLDEDLDVTGQPMIPSFELANRALGVFFSMSQGSEFVEFGIPIPTRKKANYKITKDTLENLEIVEC